MSSLAIFTIAIVLIDAIGGVILVCIDAKNCSSNTREKRISKANNKQNIRIERLKEHEQPKE